MRKILGIVWLLSLSVGVSWAQQTVITGKVKDARDGLPLSAVTVKVKGNPAGVQTDIDGNFRIQVSGKQNVLVFSYVGYAPEEVNVGARSVNITVSLSTEDRKREF